MTFSEFECKICGRDEFDEYGVYCMTCELWFCRECGEKLDCLIDRSRDEDGESTDYDSQEFPFCPFCYDPKEHPKKLRKDMIALLKTKLHTVKEEYAEIDRRLQETRKKIQKLKSQE